MAPVPDPLQVDHPPPPSFRRRKAPVPDFRLRPLHPGRPRFLDPRVRRQKGRRIHSGTQKRTNRQGGTGRRRCEDSPSPGLGACGISVTVTSLFAVPLSGAEVRSAVKEAFVCRGDSSLLGEGPALPFILRGWCSVAANSSNYFLNSRLLLRASGRGIGNASVMTESPFHPKPKK